MSTFNKLEFYREIYYKEIERKCDLNNDLSLPIGIISILSTALFFFLSTFDYKLSVIYTSFFSAFALLGIISIVTSIVFLILAYDSHPWAKPYDYLGYPNQISEFHSDYIKYFEETEANNSAVEDKADTELVNYLLKAYIRTSTINMVKTDARSSQLHKSKSYLLLSFILLLLAFIPYIINNLCKPETTHKVEIAKMPKNDLDTSKYQLKYKLNFMSEEKETTPKPPPTPPADRHVKGIEPLPKPAPAPTKPEGQGN